MSTVQVVGIAIAVVILIVLVISLVVTRRKDAGFEPSREPEPADPAEDSGSFFDAAPRDELHMLGKQDVPSPAASPPPAGWQLAAEASSPPAAWQPPAAVVVPEAAAYAEPASQPELSPSPGSETPPAADADVEETTAEIPIEEPDATPMEQAVAVTETERAEPLAEPVPPTVDTSPTEPLADRSTTREPAASVPEPASPAGAGTLVTGEPDVTASPAEAAAGEPASGRQAAPPAQPRMVRLSDIIVTTNEQQVDLADPEVRRMLKDLVQDEIDLAAQYRELGQNIDAVLQLTEAGRICDALGMTSHAKMIRQMVKELQE